MENSLKNQLERMFVLMEYKYSSDRKCLIKEEIEEKKEGKTFRMNRVGGGIRIQDPKTGEKIDVPYEDIDQFLEKFASIKKI